MKRYILSSVAIACLLAGCKEDNFVPNPLGEGREIRFGAVVNDGKTRTYYGDETTVNNSPVWPLYWNSTANGGVADQIFIYSPQAAAGRNQAVYSVDVTAADQSTATSVTRQGAYGVQAGPTNTGYDFYAFYPAAFVTSPSTEAGVINASLPSVQDGKFNGLVPSTAEVGASYTLSPDMNCCMMTAVTTNQTLTEDGAVGLAFEPLSTVLDITVNGPENNTTGTARITSVTVQADAPITGDFSWDLEKDQNQFTAGANALNTVTINTMGMDKDGDYVGIPLTTDNTLKLQAFILPNPTVTSLKVIVTTSDSKVLTKTLNMEAALQPHHIHKVNLPKVNVAEAQFDYTVWLSQLDPRIYLSEISLPGSCYSFSRTGGNPTIPLGQTTAKITNTQSLSIEEQFDAGIRVFSTHVWTYKQVSEVDGDDTSIAISVLGNTIPRSDYGVSGSGVLTLVDVLKILCAQMQGPHADEFCVLMLSDYIIPSSDKVNQTNMNIFLSRMKVILDSPKVAPYIVTDFNENTTIQDVKGKVLIKLQTNNKDISDYSDINGANCVCNAWKEDVGSMVAYAQLEWSKGPVGTDIEWKYVAPNPMLYIYSEKAEAVKDNTTSLGWNNDSYFGDSGQVSAYYTNYNSDNHNIFGMSWLGGNGFKRVFIGSTTTSQVADHYNQLWTNRVNALQQAGAKPYGWVMVNCVGSNSSTKAVIAKVISQNNDNAFKLNRNKSQVITPVNAPQGDSRPVNAGGSLF